MSKGLVAEDIGLRAETAKAAGPAVEGLDLGYYRKVLVRERRLIGLVVGGLTALALLYVLVATPKYTASASMMIDMRKNQLFENQQVVTDPTLDTSGVESQVEVLKSESVALSVIRKLKLADNPDFMHRSLLGRLLPTAWFGSSEAPSAYRRERAAVAVFDKNLKVKRLGLTYVMSVSMTTTSPELSAAIANEVVTAYRDNEADARFQATARAADWLQGRIRELRTEAINAEHAVQRFRSDNEIVDTGRGLLSEQQIGDLSSQLVLAQAATSEAKAKLERVEAIAKQDLPDDTVTDALKNDVITRLRAQYLDLSARQADWAVRYGAKHQATLHLQEQMKQIKLSIRDEIQRIDQTYKSDYQIAQSREVSLRKSLGKLVNAAGAEGQTTVKLHDLESSAQSARNLYDSFLQKFMESAQQKSLPTNDARLITAATPPTEKSSPNGMLVIPAAAFLGLLFGCTAAIGRDRFDTAFRSAKDIEMFTGIDCLGFLPKLGEARTAPIALLGAARRLQPELPASKLHEYRYVLASPFSRFAETIRSVKVAVDIMALTRRMKVVGVVSALSGEGKTTTAANLALLMASNRKKVLLLDCDLRNPALTKALTPGATTGLLDVLNRTKSLSEVICVDEETGLHFVPTALPGRISYTSDLLSSPVMAEFLRAASETYQYVIVDLPPMTAVVDVRAMGHLIDGFVQVVEWGRTSRDVVLSTLRSTEGVREKMLGLVLNKANERVIERSGADDGHYHNSKYYQ